MCISEKDSAAAAIEDLPVGIGALGGALQEGGEEEVPAANGAGQVPGTEATRDEGGDAMGPVQRVGAVVATVDEEPEQRRRRVEGAEAALEVRGGGHRAAPCPTGESGADERGEG